MTYPSDFSRADRVELALQMPEGCELKAAYYGATLTTIVLIIKGTHRAITPARVSFRQHWWVHVGTTSGPSGARVLYSRR